MILTIAFMLALAGFTTGAWVLAWIALGLGILEFILRVFIQVAVRWIQKQEPDFQLSDLDDLEKAKAKYNHKQPQDHKKSTKKK